MDKVLVVGIDTVVGGNLAIGLSQQSTVVGISLGTPVKIAGIQIESRSPSNLEGIRQSLDKIKPDRVVFCGRSSRSGWEEATSPSEEDVTLAAWWSEAINQTSSQLTLISSDSVFTGPWMFHSENSHSFCPSSAAQIVRDIETRIMNSCPNALVIRTNAFGWQSGEKPGWIESLLTRLENGQETTLDCVRYASPILASDLTDILTNAWSVGLSGLYHVGGAERVNPVQFASRLASLFHYPIPHSATKESLTDRPSGFGCGETSLQTRKIRRALGVAMPMLEESLQRLVAENQNGHRKQLSGQDRSSTVRVA